MAKITDRKHGTINPWFIFTLCAAAFFMVFLNRMSTAVIASDIKSEFSASAAQLGLLSSVYFYVYGFLQIPVGILTDRIGSRKMMAGGLLIAVGGSVLFALSRSLALCIAARTITSIGVSAIYIPTLRLFLDAFGQKRFPMAASLFVAVGQCGGLAASAPLALIVQGIGWRGSFWAVASATLVIALLILFFLPRKDYKHQASYGEQPAKSPNWLGLGLLAGLGFMCFGPIMSHQGLWGVPFFMDVYRMPRVQASSMISLIPLASVAGNLLLGSLIHRIRIKKGVFLSLSVFVCILCWVPLALFTAALPIWLTYLSAFVLGLASSATGVTINSTSPQWLGNRNKAASLALINTGNMAGGAIFQLGMGWIIDAAAGAGRPVGAQYHAAYLFPFAGVVIAFGFALAVARRLRSTSRQAESGTPVAVE